MLRKIKKQYIVHSTSYIVNQISLAVLSAVLLILSFPPFNIWIFAWMAFVPLFFAIRDQKPSKAFLISYLTGFLFFLGTIYWLIHVTLPGMLVVVAYLALYFGFFGLIINRRAGLNLPYGNYLRTTNHERRTTNHSLLFIIPSAWVALEWLRANALTGFGWNLLGYSQSFNLPMIQIADIFGVYGVSFLIVMVNAAIFASVKNFKDKKEFPIPIIIAAIFTAAAFGYGTYRLNNVFTGERMKVAVVQGNIPQDEKWDRRFTDMILNRYEALTKKAALAEKIDLVIWPETSIPGFVEDEEDLFSRLRDLATGINTPLLAGAPRYKDTKDGTSYYNSAFFFLKDGSIAAHYDKVHLVPFGEYVPLKNLFFFVHRFAPRPIGDCTAGRDFTVFKFLLERGARDKDYSWKLIKKCAFSCLICFEDIFPGLARQFVNKNSDFLINITNDAWFGRSSAAYQHAQASIFRAVENRTSVLRAANTGLSCFIDQKGRITARVINGGKDLFVDGFRIHEIILSKVMTLYTRYGDVFAYVCIFFTVLNCVRLLRRPKGLLAMTGRLIFLFIAISLAGCDSNQYQMVTAPDGTLYRFNKKTGELSMMMEGKKAAAPHPESKKSEVVKGPASEIDFEKPADWKESRFPAKNLKVRLETVWRENKLCYKFSVYPYKSLEKVFARKKQDYLYSIMKPGFNIELVDKNGFVIKEIKIILWNMTGLHGEDGKPKELVMNSQVECSRQSYGSIGGYNIKWLIEPDMIEDEKEDFIKSSSIKDSGGR